MGPPCWSWWPRVQGPTPGVSQHSRVPQKQRAPLTLRSMASALGRSKERAAREQSRELRPRQPHGGSPRQRCPHLGVTSEPFQEEIVVLGGQGGQHVLQLPPELQGQEGQLVKESLILPKNFRAGDLPLLRAPPKTCQPGLGHCQGKRVTLCPSLLPVHPGSAVTWQGTVPRPAAMLRVSPSPCIRRVGCHHPAPPRVSHRDWVKQSPLGVSFGMDGGCHCVYPCPVRPQWATVPLA